MEPTLDAVLNAPYDDAPRLAYADALDARDPRAEFIRLEVRLAAEPFARPDAPDAEAEADRRADWLEAEERARELREAHALAWCAPLTDLVPDAVCTFERGFVAGIALSAQAFVEHGAALVTAAPIVCATLREARGHLGEALRAPQARSLRALSLAHCGLEDADMIEVATSPQLERLTWLDLAGNRVGLRGLRLLAASRLLPNLRYLGLTGNALDPREQASEEWGRVVDVSFPPEGAELERDYGPLPWLHVDPTDAHAYPPSPFARP